MAKLIVQDGYQRGVEFAVQKQTIVGRADRSEAPLLDPSVSRRHAVLTYVDRTCQISDLGSANGTFVNGRRISAATELHDGDIVAIGSIHLIYRDHPEARSPIADGRVLNRIEAGIVERDLALAGRIQRRFMPRSAPALSGYSFAWEYRPALAVGGDFYDFLDLGAGFIGVAVGDVSGKGISAALYAAKLMSDLRHQAVGLTNPAEILARTNSVLTADDHEGMFATAALIVLDSRSGRLSLSSAGHPLPLVRNRHGCTTTLGRIGDAPLGLDPTVVFGLSEYEIEPDAAVILYTDGIVEAINDRQELYGVHRLARAVEGADGTMNGIVSSILVDLRVFVGEQDLNDDLTVVVFARSLTNA